MAPDTSRTVCRCTRTQNTGPTIFPLRAETLSTAARSQHCGFNKTTSSPPSYNERLHISSARSAVVPRIASAAILEMQNFLGGGYPHTPLLLRASRARTLVIVSTASPESWWLRPCYYPIDGRPTLRELPTALLCMLFLYAENYIHFGC